MWRADTWAAFGTGLVMTAAGLIFHDHALWLLIAAAVCYAVAVMSYLRNRRRLAKKKAALLSNVTTAPMPAPERSQSPGVTIIGGDFSDNGRHGINIGSGARVQVSGATANRNKGDGVHIGEPGED